MWSQSRLGRWRVDGLRPVFFSQLISDYRGSTDWEAGEPEQLAGHLAKGAGAPGATAEQVPGFSASHGAAERPWEKASYPLWALNGRTVLASQG